MDWTSKGEALDRAYAVKAEPWRFQRYLDQTHHELIKECLGRLLPIHHRGRLFSIADMRAMLDLDDRDRSYQREHGG